MPHPLFQCLEHINIHQLATDGALSPAQEKQLQTLGQQIQAYFAQLCPEKRVYTVEEVRELVLLNLARPSSVAYEQSMLTKLLCLSDYFEEKVQSNMHELYVGIEIQLLNEQLDFCRKRCATYLRHLEQAAETARRQQASSKACDGLKKIACLEQSAIIDAKIDFINKLSASLDCEDYSPRRQLEAFKSLLTGRGSQILQIRRTNQDSHFLQAIKAFFKPLLPTSFFKSSGEKLQEELSRRLVLPSL